MGKVQFERMEALSGAYQEERQELEIMDLTTLTIQALCHLAPSATYATYATSATSGVTPSFTITTAQVRQAILDHNAEEEVKPEFVTPTRVGRTLAKMRLRQEPRPTGRGSRCWRVSQAELVRWAGVYGLSGTPETGACQVTPLSN